MGSVLTGAGSVVGGLFGGIGKGAADSSGATSNYQTGNPYDQNYFQQQLSNQAQIYGNQQSLAQALQAQMLGQGPNPAQTQFQGNVQSNIANAQGLIASQRGLNPALAARMGVNAAAKANQEAALGSALLQQQQQIAATQNLGGLYGQMQQGNLGAQQLYNEANLGQAKLNANTASENAKTRGQLTGGIMNAAAGAGAKAATSGAAHGGIVAGAAQVAGDSPQNDTVPVMLSPDEIVIPRSMAHDPEKAKEFIDHLLKDVKKSEVGYGDVIKARRKAKGK